MLRPRTFAMPLVAHLTLGCTGGTVAAPVGPSTGEGLPAPSCQTSLAEQPLRRLSSSQYANTLRDLFGADLARPLLADSLFPKTTLKQGFSADAEANIVNTSESQGIEDNAERVARLVEADLERYLVALLPCELGTPATDAAIEGCMPRFVAAFGERAYRRPLSAVERERVLGLVETVRQTSGARSGFVSAIQFFVQAPAFLYRVERGEGEVVGGRVRLSDYELASRLSYLFMDSMPDTPLFEAARRGELHTRPQIEAQAMRLMEGEAFREVLGGFHRDWLHLYELENASRSVVGAPELTPALRESLSREVPEFVRRVFDAGDGRLATLLSSSVLSIDAQLAPLYGEQVAPGAGWVAVEKNDRRGLLTLASVMATLSMPDRPHPIHRGAFIVRDVLCRDLPALPGNVDISTPLESAASAPTARERYAPLLQDAACRGCHSQFNPVGLAFETYDALGRYRGEESGVPIDPSGEINLGQGPVAFGNALELSAALATSEAVRDCYAKTWYRAVLGRPEYEADACALSQLSDVMRQSDGDVRSLLLSIVQSDAFLFRKVTP